MQALARDTIHSDGTKLLETLTDAFQELNECLTEVCSLLDRDELDRTRLTTVRLRIAQLRLTRSMIINDSVKFLRGRVAQSEADLLDALSKGNEELLKIASAHTTKWDLASITAHWDEYRTTARSLVDAWLEKMRWEQGILYPLLKRHG